ncbi:TPA: LysM peptidoglycan-binding domain-containing protein, partial [Yersinia enterocolitica]|nr:LysM peptidoglycan-binding domain-containing protein [Yersinia enterocolitica]
MNILFQLAFPLSLSFTPARAMAPASPHQQTAFASKPYVLAPGENVKTVAKTYGLSVDELKKINQYRTFAKPFNALTAGDEIDVPR